VEPRNLNRPSYVLALLLGFIAIADAFSALLGMQSSDLCSSLSSLNGLSCRNAGWFIDLMTSGVSAALLALAGHLFPVWLRFRGGRGVATGAGVFLPISWQAVVGAAVVGAAVVGAAVVGGAVVAWV
jgi:glycerol-3-phosphate acyltransferase PlsY